VSELSLEPQSLELLSLELLSLEQRERDDHWMGLALAEADRAAEAGDVPVGAVIVNADGDLLAEGRNRRELDGDPTAHAEVDALRRAARRLGHWRVEGTLYVTLEPCLMCAGALVNARIKRVVYGALDPKAGAVQSLYQAGADRRLNHQFSSTEGVRAVECAGRLQAFFAALRARGEK
jgi:tRNA(adenine34) deaminase